MARSEYFQTCYGGVKFLDGVGPSLTNVERLDLGALPMIHHMMATGMEVDVDHFRHMDKILTQDMERITEKVHDETGIYTNLGSGDQVSDLLFKKLGLKQIRPKMTASGDRESVEYEVLVAVQHQHTVVGDCIEYKEVEKLRGTYARPMPKLAKRGKDGEWRLYPNLGVTRIPSSRLNAKKPNLLAMPNKTVRAKELCKGFITKPGWVYLSVDESQIEPRVAAHRSQDTNLINVYKNLEDIYSDFAISAFQIPDKRYQNEVGKWIYPGVDKEQHRFPAKTCTLASFYEVSGAGLCEQMPVVCRYCHVESKFHDRHKCNNFTSLWNEDNCQDLINRFGMRYPGVLIMRSLDHKRAMKNTYLWDDWGRILHVMAVKSIHPWVISAALREGGNFPIQATAQGTVKLAMAKIMDDFREWGILGEICNPLLQIHDEILFECRRDHADMIGQYVVSVFENIVRLRVPIKAEYSMADNWGSLVK